MNKGLREGKRSYSSILRANRGTGTHILIDETRSKNKSFHPDLKLEDGMSVGYIGGVRSLGRQESCLWQDWNP